MSLSFWEMGAGDASPAFDIDRSVRTSGAAHSGGGVAMKGEFGDKTGDRGNDDGFDLDDGADAGEPGEGDGERDTDAAYPIEDGDAEPSSGDPCIGAEPSSGDPCIGDTRLDGGMGTAAAADNVGDGVICGLFRRFWKERLCGMRGDCVDNATRWGPRPETGERVEDDPLGGYILGGLPDMGGVDGPGYDEGLPEKDCKENFVISGGGVMAPTVVCEFECVWWYEPGVGVEGPGPKASRRPSSLADQVKSVGALRWESDGGKLDEKTSCGGVGYAKCA